MSVATFTKSGTKAATPIKLDKAVFGAEVKSHQLLKDAYLAHLANARNNPAQTKRRGEVSGSGKKPWRQKGTGRARAGSKRSPLWRGGGITFGPTGQENFSRRMTPGAKRQALKQALSLAADKGQLIVIEDFSPTGNKTKAAADFISKIGATGNINLVLPAGHSAWLAARNLPNVQVIDVAFLGVFDVMNADSTVISKAALEALQARLTGGQNG